jgi:hypothetical protein
MKFYNLSLQLIALTRVENQSLNGLILHDVY